MILIPIFLVLFACWMLWGWIVGESKNIKWLRHWCAPIFVMTVMLISAGAGAGITATLIRNQTRNDVAKLLETIEQKITSGHGHEVVGEIHATDRSEDPDRDAFDLLKHLAVMQKNLSPPVVEQIAEATKERSAIR